MDKKNYIFDHKGNCIEHAKMLEYVQGRLSPKEDHIIEKHLLSCDLCNEAVEGLQMINENGGDLDKILHKIQGNIEARTKPSFRFRLTMVASVLLLVSIGIYSILNNNQQKDSIAQLEEKPITEQETNLEEPIETDLLEKENVEDSKTSEEALTENGQQKVEEEQISLKKDNKNLRNKNGDIDITNTLTTKASTERIEEPDPSRETTENVFAAKINNKDNEDEDGLAYANVEASNEALDAFAIAENNEETNMIPEDNNIVEELQNNRNSGIDDLDDEIAMSKSLNEADVNDLSYVNESAGMVQQGFSDKVPYNQSLSLDPLGTETNRMQDQEKVDQLEFMNTSKNEVNKVYKAKQERLLTDFKMDQSFNLISDTNVVIDSIPFRMYLYGKTTGKTEVLELYTIEHSKLSLVRTFQSKNGLKWSINNKKELCIKELSVSKCYVWNQKNKQFTLSNDE